jgi:hypothetical protein
MTGVVHVDLVAASLRMAQHSEHSLTIIRAPIIKGKVNDKPGMEAHIN